MAGGSSVVAAIPACTAATIATANIVLHPFSIFNPFSALKFLQYYIK